MDNQTIVDPGFFTDILTSVSGKQDDSSPKSFPGDSGISQSMAAPEDPKDAEKEEKPPQNKIFIVTKALKSIEQNIATIIRLLEEDPQNMPQQTSLLSHEPIDTTVLREIELAGMKASDGRVIEGVFDGQSMVGSDGKIYTIPPNYASKSKLVEGDLLKLTMTPRGSFIFKQIGPIDRNRIVASLGFDPTIGEYYATTEDHRWAIIKASVTYFKGEAGDEIILLVPKNTPSKWAAVENVIKKNPLN